jgi:RimJ/RimL family protein N-acetyltransferase
LQELEKMVVVDPKYVVRTERLLLRPMKLEDAEDVVLLRKNAEVMKHTYVVIWKSWTLSDRFKVSVALRRP